ncbi:MAG: hypothetical protein RLZZ396_1179 [Planctomycetota bacterium]|jgi:hypothetical protein
MIEVWSNCTGDSLRQGDIIEDCDIAVVPDDFSTSSDEDIIDVEKRRLIVITQSCDLENGKAPFVALCPVYTVSEFQKSQMNFASLARLEEIRKGRVEGLYMLPSTNDPSNNLEALIADFRMIVSLPIGYLSRKASDAERRSRLLSPFVEHFSQAFARFFMRVGLPSQIPTFKSK